MARELPPARSIRPPASPSLSSSSTLSICSDENCWCPSRTASDCADWMNPRARSVYFSIFMICFPRPAAPAPKAQAPHLHWVSAHRVDIPQPAAVVSPAKAGMTQMWASGRKIEGPGVKFGNAGGAKRNLLHSRMPEARSAEVTGISRYPVKGLSPEPPPHVALAPGQPLPADRRYAIENGPSGFDPAHPKWMAKVYFLMLMRDEWLAGMHTHFDDASNVLTISRDGSIAAQGDLDTAQGRAAIEQYFASNFANEIKGPLKILRAKDLSFSNVDRKVVSII